MVPAEDKKDTEQLLNSIREQVETASQEILGWVLPKDQTTNDAEAQALRKLAARSAQQTRQWTGRMLKELDTVYPYPHSSDSSTDIIDKTSVPQTTGYDLPADFPVVRRIKHVRMNLSVIKVNLDDLLGQCVPGSFFNQCLFRVMENAIQTGMWLGELLHEFYAAQPKADPEAVVPEKDLSGSTTPSSTPTESSFTGSDTPTASSSSSTESEAVASKNELSPSTSLPTEEPSTATTTSGSGSEPSSPSASGSSGSEPALREVEGASEALTAAAEAETSADSVREL